MSRRLEDSSDVARAGEIRSTLQILVLPCHFLSLSVDSVITERCSEEKKTLKRTVLFFLKLKIMVSRFVFVNLWVTEIHPPRPPPLPTQCDLLTWYSTASFWLPAQHPLMGTRLPCLLFPVSSDNILQTGQRLASRRELLMLLCKVLMQRDVLLSQEGAGAHYQNYVAPKSGQAGHCVSGRGAIRHITSRKQTNKN